MIKLVILNWDLSLILCIVSEEKYFLVFQFEKNLSKRKLLLTQAGEFNGATPLNPARHKT